MFPSFCFFFRGKYINSRGISQTNAKKRIQILTAFDLARQYLCPMNIFKVLFELFLFYLLYKLVFQFIIPVYRASKRMKDQVGEMQEKMHQQQQTQAFQQTKVSSEKAKTTSAKTSSSDYIDFEEVK